MENLPYLRSAKNREEYPSTEENTVDGRLAMEKAIGPSG